MARRPSPEEFDRPLTTAELAERRRRLAMLSPHQVAEAYRQAHEACRMEGDRLPRASAVQELVTAWRVLWKWRRRGRWGGVEMRYKGIIWNLMSGYWAMNG
jgi:hypothetical protein